MINKVILLGNLGNDPEIRYTPNGGAIANLSIATSESWKDRNTGERREKTEWHRVVIFGKLAEIAGKYLRKGSQVYLEGKLQTRKWQDQSGVDRYSTEVVIDIGGVMKMIGTKADNQQRNNNQEYQKSAPQQDSPSNDSSQFTNDSFDDDIPF